MTIEYRVIPAPAKAVKAKGVRPENRFAHTVTAALNEMGREGWEYVRTETLPVEERSGLASKSINQQVLMVFRREVAPRAEVMVHARPDVAANEDAPASAAPVTASKGTEGLGAAAKSLFASRTAQAAPEDAPSLKATPGSDT
ncbi:hypothetical protein AQS8620_01189 [Aquimixticola soesokkakensis]|uniref:DUF4177 domain-containing protein n=1 Tax=Aquimixticola soesokkakensis TaxID=1519096 RepID=A0A1Y5SDE9_9RHOB|nr:hypothetical protein [Aquimixticola soesokkakensis]SLN35100.1 hypothetical protein AQS8620_01189 [Aquimixticola soesokkakensis]